MSVPDRSNAPGRRLSPRPLPGTQQRTVLGVGVPVAPSFLELEDEETVAYNARSTRPGSVPGLRAKCVETAPSERTSDRTDASLVSLSDDDVEVLTAVEANAAPRSIPTPPPPPRARVGVPVAPQLARASLPEPEHFRMKIGGSSYPPQSVPPELARPRPSQRRSFWAKFLFMMIVVVVLLLIATEVSIVRNLPWLDPRPVLLKLWHLAAQKIPWQSLPKLKDF
jgi:hypothetical protein